MSAIGFAAGINGAMQGLQTGMQMRRQKMLDDLARQQFEQKKAFEEAAMRRLDASQKAQQTYYEGMNADRLKDNADRERKSTFDQFMSPGSPYRSGPVGEMVAPEIATAEAAGQRYARAKPMEQVKPYDPKTGQGGVGPEDVPNIREGIEDEAFKTRDDAFSRAAKIAREYRDREMGIKADKAAPKHSAYADELSKRRTMVSDAQTKEITGIDTGVERQKQIRGTAQSLATKYPGIYGSVWNDVEKKLNVDDPEVSAFKAFVGLNLAEYVFEVSGKAVTDAERKFLMQIQPQGTDRVETLIKKSQQFEKWLGDKRRITVGNIKKQGKDTAAFEADDAPAQALSAEDQEAKAWAEANPRDPRATKILQRLKGR
jgi:hypothetical protein